MTVKENLIAAKALIDTPEKWGKYGWAPKGGDCLCALGAAVVAANGDRNFDFAWTPAVLAVEARLKAVLPPEHGNVADFNDHNDTTHDMVMQLYDRAIAAADDT